MPEIKTNEELSLDDSVKVNNKGNPILGRLQGPCADFLQPTRNGIFIIQRAYRQHKRR